MPSRGGADAARFRQGSSLPALLTVAMELIGQGVSRSISSGHRHSLFFAICCSSGFDGRNRVRLQADVFPQAKDRVEGVSCSADDIAGALRARTPLGEERGTIFVAGIGKQIALLTRQGFGFCGQVKRP